MIEGVTGGASSRYSTLLVGSGGPAPEFASAWGSGDRTVCADASIEPAEEVGLMQVIVAAFLRTETRA